MSIFKKIFNAVQPEIKCNEPDIESFREFCKLILMKKHDDIVEKCVEFMKYDNTNIETILYALSGYDDLYYTNGDVFSDKALVCEMYMVSSDTGYPDMQTFFEFINMLRKNRKLDFDYNKNEFSKNRAMDRWLGELAGQLSDLYILIFDVGSDTYHYIITDKDTGTRVKTLFEKATKHDKSYHYTADFIDGDFCK